MAFEQLANVIDFTKKKEKNQSEVRSNKLLGRATKKFTRSFLLLLLSLET
jgi:hypothetical protein